MYLVADLAFIFISFSLCLYISLQKIDVLFRGFGEDFTFVVQ